MRYYIIAYTLLAGVFIGFGHSLPVALSALLKILPLLLLLFLVARSFAAYSGLLILALVFGLGGDVAMAFERFMLGLGLFLVGHIFYIGLWCQQLDVSRCWRLIPLLLLTIAGASYLLPHTGEMMVAVALYFSVITLMAATASLSSIASGLGLLGAYSFLVSDFVIGWNKFIEPLQWAPSVIMVTYYLAQLLMVVAVIRFQRHQVEPA